MAREEALDPGEAVRAEADAGAVGRELSDAEANGLLDDAMTFAEAGIAAIGQS